VLDKIQNMKRVVIVIFLMYVGVSFSQTIENVDQRLVNNHGESINRIYEKQKKYYDFLVWELNNGYKIIELSILESKKLNIASASDVVDVNGDVFNIDELNTPDLFNFVEFTFEREKETDVYYDLGNGTAIMFYSVSSVWNKYKKLN